MAPVTLSRTLHLLIALPTFRVKCSSKNWTNLLICGAMPPVVQSNSTTSRLDKNASGRFFFLDGDGVVSREFLGSDNNEYWYLVIRGVRERICLFPKELSIGFFPSDLDIRLAKSCLSSAFCLLPPISRGDFIAIMDLAWSSDRERSSISLDLISLSLSYRMPSKSFPSFTRQSILHHIIFFKLKVILTWRTYPCTLQRNSNPPPQ